jgi:hypothetical protein
MLLCFLLSSCKSNSWSVWHYFSLCLVVDWFGKVFQCWAGLSGPWGLELPKIVGGCDAGIGGCCLLAVCAFHCLLIPQTSSLISDSCSWPSNTDSCSFSNLYVNLQPFDGNEVDIPIWLIGSPGQWQGILLIRKYWLEGFYGKKRWLKIHKLLNNK